MFYEIFMKVTEQIVNPIVIFQLILRFWKMKINRIKNYEMTGVIINVSRKKTHWKQAHRKKAHRKKAQAEKRARWKKRIRKKSQ